MPLFFSRCFIPLLLFFSALPLDLSAHDRYLSTQHHTADGDQIFYGAAAIMFLIYYGYYKIWSIFVPCVMSAFFISYLFGMKVYLEEYAPQKAAANAPTDLRLGSALLSDTQRRSDDGGEEMVL